MGGGGRGFRKTLSLAGAATVSVRWVNTDYVSNGYSGSSSVVHRIVSDDGTSFDTGNLDGNETSSKALAAGSYSYHCSIHPAMVGTVTVNP